MRYLPFARSCLFSVLLVFSAQAHSVSEDQDIDGIITNPKMRAESGSKSRYSISSSLGYSGGSLRTPLSDKKPNIGNGTGTTDFASLDGSLSARYGVSVKTAIFAGFGFRLLTPLRGSSTPDGYHGNKLDLSSPGITLQHLYRPFTAIQSAFSLSETIFTTSDLVKQGYLTSWSVGQNNIWEVGRTDFSIGINVFGGYFVFSNRQSRYLSQQSDYYVGLSPSIEYGLNKTFRLYAGTNLFSFEHIRAQSDGWTFRRNQVTASLGLGIVLRRDVYVSPGVSFVPSDIQSARTNWSISSSINLF